MYKLATDSSADLTKEFLAEHDIACINLSYIVDGETYGQGKEIEPKAFYDLMREGKMPTTSQINPEEAKAYFEKEIETYKEILFLAFSSELSGSYHSTKVAAEEVMEEHPDCRIVVVDTLCATVGQGLIVYKAAQLRDQGKSLDEVVEWVEQHKLNVVHVLFVEDLYHLYRGGRLSKTSAVVGTLAGIKPIIHVNDKGGLSNIAKARGRKKSMAALVDYMGAKLANYDGESDMVMISHADAEEDALQLRDMIKERFGIENFCINYVGPVIGSHTGPGMIGVFFMGESR